MLMYTVALKTRQEKKIVSFSVWCVEDLLNNTDIENSFISASLVQYVSAASVEMPL